MDKDSPLAVKKKWGSGAPHVLSVEWGELPTLEIVPWLSSKQINCFTTAGK